MTRLSDAIELYLECPLCKSESGLYCEIGYDYDEGDVDEDGNVYGPYAYLTTNLLRVECGCDRDAIMDEFDSVNEQGKDSYDRPEYPPYPV